MSNSKHLQEEEALVQECKDLMSTLPREKSWFASHMYLYQGFWYEANNLESIISSQKHFQAQDSDILLATNPKTGTTWFKAIIFALLNRKQFPVGKNHPLLTHNPHELVLTLGFSIPTDKNLLANIASTPSPRFYSTHLPYVSLPESVKSNSTCKLVYVCRDPKDTFVSLWHFANKFRVQKVSIGEDFEMFCKGLSIFGPLWDHILGYWKQSKEDPDKVFFVKYEDMKEQPRIHLRRLAEFLGCPFSTDEEEAGRVEEISELCSFDNMSSLEVNKKGILRLDNMSSPEVSKNEILANGMVSKDFFRKGEVGDWKNYLSAEMADKLDKIVQEKFFGSGLVL